MKHILALKNTLESLHLIKKPPHPPHTDALTSQVQNSSFIPLICITQSCSFELEDNSIWIVLFRPDYDSPHWGQPSSNHSYVPLDIRARCPPPSLCHAIRDNPAGWPLLSEVRLQSSAVQRSADTFDLLLIMTCPTQSAINIFKQKPA